MCPPPLPSAPRARIPRLPLYASKFNDWYWAYGKNTADPYARTLQHIVELSPTGENRPFVVIDDGWQPGRGADKSGTGTWDHGNEKFGDMSHARLRRSTRGRSAGHLDSPTASAGDRARFVAPGTRPRDARPNGS